MKTLLRSSLIAVLATASFAGLAAQSSNFSFPTAPKPTSSGTGSCCVASTSLK